MIVIAFNGSHRSVRGNTSVMVEELLDGVSQAGGEVEHIRLVEHPLEFCRACKNCWFKTPGQCHLADEGNALLAKFTRADVVVLASPLYVDNVTGLMKVFLDRLIAIGDPRWVVDNRGECVHRSRFPKPKALVALMNAGYPEQTHFSPMRELFRRMARNLHVDLVGEVYRGGGALLTNGDPTMIPAIDAYFDLLRQAGREIVTHGRISSEVSDSLEKPLLDRPDFALLYREKVNAMCAAHGLSSDPPGA